MRQNVRTKNGFTTFQAVFIVMIFIITLVSGASLWALTNNKSPAVSKLPSESSGGTVAVLSQLSETQQTNEEVRSPKAYSTLPYELQLPAEWAVTDSKTEKNPCGDDDDWVTTTYKSGQETLVVYENGNPTGCDGSIIVDVYLDFDFTDDFTGIVVNDGAEILQCNKQQNPTCPKGDGAVSIFIGNQTSATVPSYRVNELNGRTYYFSIKDTKLDSDLVSQVRSLASIIKAIKFQ